MQTSSIPTAVLLIVSSCSIANAGMTTLWVHDSWAAATLQTFQSPSGELNVAYVDGNNTLSALPAGNGSFIWRTPHSRPPQNAMNIYQAGSLLIVNDAAGNCSAYTTNTGKFMWSFKSSIYNEYIDNVFVVAATDAVVVLFQRYVSVYSVISAISGELMWSANCSSPMRRRGAAATDMTVFLLCGAEVTSYELASGTVEWTTTVFSSAAYEGRMAISKQIQDIVKYFLILFNGPTLTVLDVSGKIVSTSAFGDVDVGLMHVAPNSEIVAFICDNGDFKTSSVVAVRSIEPDIGAIVWNVTIPFTDTTGVRPCR